MPHITGQPVRRHSRLRGRCEPWRPTDRRTVQRIVLAARRFELARKPWGRRNGPLGGIALEVLALLANVVDFRTGRLEPSLDWIQGKLRRSRDAIVRALKALRAHGFLDWLRRFEPTGAAAGPQVRQVSNAYRLSLPPAGAQALGRFGAPPIPDDVEAALAARSVAVATYGRDEPPLIEGSVRQDKPQGIPDYSGDRIEVSPGLLALLKQRESARRTEPQHVNFLRMK